MRPITKTRISLCVNTKLLSAVDNIIKKYGYFSRSSVIEDALYKWYNDFMEAELNRQTEEYYRSLSSEEIEEDKQWTQISTKQSNKV